MASLTILAIVGLLDSWRRGWGSSRTMRYAHMRDCDLHPIARGFLGKSEKPTRCGLNRSLTETVAGKVRLKTLSDYVRGLSERLSLETIVDGGFFREALYLSTASRQT